MMAIPKYNELYTEVLDFLKDGTEYKTSEMKKILSKQLNLTEDELNELIPSGVSTVIESRIGWSITYLKKAGLLESRKRGLIRITEEGKKELSLKNHVDDEDLEKYPSFVEFKNNQTKPAKKKKNYQIKSKRDTLTPEERIEASFNTINQNLADEILQTIHNMNPVFFERLVVDLLLKMGYGGFREDAGFETSPTNDEGIDGIINEDKLGLDKLAIQAKRYENNHKIGRPLVQNFVGALIGKGLTKGVFITTSSFTQSAMDYVENQSNLTIVLIDGEKLANLMIEYDLGTSTISTYHLKRIDSDYFNE